MSIFDLDDDPGPRKRPTDNYKVLMLKILEGWKTEVDTLYKKPLNEWTIIDAYSAQKEVEWATSQNVELYSSSLKMICECITQLGDVEFIYLDILDFWEFKLRTIIEKAFTYKWLWNLNRFLYFEEYSNKEKLNKFRRLILFRTKRRNRGNK